MTQSLIPNLNNQDFDESLANKYLHLMIKSPIYDLVNRTPIDKLTKLSRRLENNITVKREDLHQIHSFKIRGSYNKVKQLVLDKGKDVHVIAASAGNHAQGVAMSAKHLGIRATIVMPRNTPQIKVDSVADFGAKVILSGNAFSEALDKALEMAKVDPSLEFIHAYDDPLVIAGQGTIGLELLQDQEKIDYVFVPIGGGGLAAGVAAIIKALNNQIKVIGVEEIGSASMSQAFINNKPVRLNTVNTFAEGVAVAQAGDLTYEICNQYLDDLITVTTDEICATIKDIYEDIRSIPEASGAISVAGIKKYCKLHNLRNQNMIGIISGANLNFYNLRFICERTEIGESREAIFGVGLAEKPGEFRRLINSLGGVQITEFNYRHSSDYLRANVFIGFTTLNSNQRHQIFEKLHSLDFPVVDFHEDEIAKSHTRFMLGGKINLANERLFEITLLDRSGSIADLLDILDDRWNISLFHYRFNPTGSSSLLGLEIEDENVELFIKQVNDFGLMINDVTNSTSYGLFLVDK